LWRVLNGSLSAKKEKKKKIYKKKLIISSQFSILSYDKINFKSIFFDKLFKISTLVLIILME